MLRNSTSPTPHTDESDKDLCRESLGLSAFGTSDETTGSDVFANIRSCKEARGMRQSIPWSPADILPLSDIATKRGIVDADASGWGLKCGGGVRSRGCRATGSGRTKPFRSGRVGSAAGSLNSDSIQDLLSKWISDGLLGSVCSSSLSESRSGGVHCSALPCLEPDVSV